MGARTPRGSFKHGTSGYNNYGCRCTVCRDAAVTYMREYRAARRANPTGRRVPHGTSTGYGVDGCRCEACVTFKRDADRKYSEQARERRRDAQGDAGH